MTFDDIKAAFWSGGTYGVQPALTQAAVVDAEQALGLRLPASLLDLLRVQNGGGVTADRDAFPTDHPTSWSEDHIPFTELMGIGTGGHGLSLLETPYLVKEWGLPSPVVLLSGDGHYWIGLDYRANGAWGEPSVTWFDTDSGAELPLAADFRTFVEGLQPMARFGGQP
ncbi:SMI1/KNR4 family protein [Streptomyces sp. MAR4 CNX-425]|uniref:SMI1/KNR4 family protein n=1 Tax=Streptomyces sp. MAR4 CNX-425 TaxID=3406343 RepID=UPI003B51077B